VAHDLSDLFAELDEAKADLQRQVRHSRAFLDSRRPREPGEDVEASSPFGWERTEPS
jgi:hypothetical protein